MHQTPNILPEIFNFFFKFYGLISIMTQIIKKDIFHIYYTFSSNLFIIQKFIAALFQIFVYEIINFILFIFKFHFYLISIY
jgi:hypothetical protein